jgi:hypothetical protein
MQQRKRCPSGVAVSCAVGDFLSVRLGKTEAPERLRGDNATTVSDTNSRQGLTASGV